MKMIRRFAQVVTLMLGLLSATVVPITTYAADEVHGKFTLTSETHWGANVLPAGDYTYALTTGGAMPVVLIRSVTGKEAAFIAPAAETDTTATTPNALKIETLGDTRVVTELHVNDQGLVLHYKIPAALESAAKLVDPKLTAYVGTK